jgi:hypothetical protein
MILSSADILRVLGGSEIIRLSAKLKIVDAKPALSGAEGLFVYVGRFPRLEEFEATWTIWIESDGSEPDDLVITEIKKLLPRVEVRPGLMVEVTTTEFRSESTQSAPEAPQAQTAQVDLSQYEERFQALVEDVQDQMLLVTSGRPGRDGQDGRDGSDGRDGRDLVATEADLEDLQNVEEGIAKKKGQVLTWDGEKWTNLFVPQIVSSISGKGGGTTINALNDIGDVDVPSPGNGSVLAYNSASGNWEAAAAPPADISGNSIDDLSDVDTTTTSPVANQPLTWNGIDNWTPGGSIQLDIANTIDPAEGEIAWEQDEHTAVLGINGIHAHLGHDTYAYCRNDTGSLIPKGTAVMFAGTLGASGRVKVAPMVADGTFPGYVFLGVAAEDMPAGQDSNVITNGKIKGYNTSALPEQAILWCDPAVPGGLTSTEPAAPNLKLPVAAVISSKTNGTLMVRWSSGSRLQDLHNVEATAPSDGQLLTWVDSNGRWEPADAPQSGIPEAPLDGNYYVRQNGAWIDLKVALASLGVATPKGIDGGNFTTGASSALDATNIDGGNLTSGTSSASSNITYDGGNLTSGTSSAVTSVDISGETIDGGNFS